MADINTALRTIRSVIDSNVIDLWERASGRNRSPEQRIFFNDLRLSGSIFPKIFLETDDGDNTKLNWGGGKNMHKNKEMFSVNIYYVSTARFKYNKDGVIYENGGANTSKDLNWYMRELIRDQLVINGKSLTGINNLRFGTLTSTQQVNDTYVGVLPITFSWIRKIGGS